MNWKFSIKISIFKLFKEYHNDDFTRQVIDRKIYTENCAKMYTENNGFQFISVFIEFIQVIIKTVLLS